MVWADWAAGSIRMVSACAAVCVPALAWTVKLQVPDAVGVPEITPVLALSASPEGRAPLEIVQVSGGVPPLATSGAV
jgi:hypothetical protein